MPGYDQEALEPYNRELIKGKKLLNVSATCIVYNCMIRAMEQVHEDLQQMVEAGKDMTFSMVRKFVVDFYNLEMADFIIYSAM